MLLASSEHASINNESLSPTGSFHDDLAEDQQREYEMETLLLGQRGQAQHEGVTTTDPQQPEVERPK